MLPRETAWAPTIKYLRGAAGIGLGTTIKYLRVAAGIGLGTTAKYLRRATRQRPGHHDDQVPATHNEQRLGHVRAAAWKPQSSTCGALRAVPLATA
jgi:hypothetical protein